MALTQVRGGQVQDGSIQRVDLDVSTVGQAVIRKLIAGGGLSLSYDGADAGTGDVTVSAPNASNWDTAYTDRNKWDGGSAGLNASTGRTSLGATALGANIFTGANNSLGVNAFMTISSLNTPTLRTAANFRADIGAEAALGNPSTDGYILSSTAAGVRSWIAPPSGSGTITLTGDVTGSGTTTIVTNIAANAVTAAEIAANTIGASEMNNTQDMLMAAAQSIRVADASNAVLNVLRIAHNYTGTPTANAEGIALSFEGKSDTTVDRTLGQIKCQWSTVADATRTSWMDLGTVLNGVLSTCVRCHGSNGMSVNNTTDPGAGFVNVPTAGGYKINNVNIFGPSMGSMANGDVLRAIGTGTFDSFTPNSFNVINMATATGTNTGTGTMCGFNKQLTMQYSGRVLVIYSGRMGNNTLNAYGLTRLHYGTGTPPTAGAAATGTAVSGDQYSLNGAPANQICTFGMAAIITGLTKGTTYWFDGLIVATAGTQSVYNGNLQIIEL